MCPKRRGSPASQWKDSPLAPRIRLQKRRISSSFQRGLAGRNQTDREQARVEFSRFVRVAFCRRIYPCRRELANDAQGALEGASEAENHASVLLKSYLYRWQEYFAPPGRRGSRPGANRSCHGSRGVLAIVEPFRKELEFSGSDVIWWPLGKERHIVVDPTRNFGQPTVVRAGVPARVLARSVKTNRSIATVSHWFEVSEQEVRDAVEFETRLAA